MAILSMSRFYTTGDQNEPHHVYNYWLLLASRVASYSVIPYTVCDYEHWTCPIIKKGVVISTLTI